MNIPGWDILCKIDWVGWKRQAHAGVSPTSPEQMSHHTCCYEPSDPPPSCPSMPAQMPLPHPVVLLQSRLTPCRKRASCAPSQLASIPLGLLPALPLQQQPGQVTQSQAWGCTAKWCNLAWVLCFDFTQLRLCAFRLILLAGWSGATCCLSRVLV